MKMFQYDPLESRLKTAFRLSNTVIPQTLGRKEFWLVLGLFILLYLLYSFGLLKHVPGLKNTARGQQMDWKEVQLTSSFTIFFEVFYTNACYSRYVTYYRNSRELFLQVMLIVYDLRIHLKQADAAHARLVYRYLLCSLLLFWEQINEERNVISLGETIRQYRSQLLTDEEDEFLSGMDPQFRYLVTMHWTMDVSHAAHEQSLVPASTVKLVLDKMQKVLLLMRLLDEELTLPIPFAYFHMLNLMVCVTLVLLAICMGLAQSHLGFIVFFIADLVFLGMLELSSEMTDPFGDDEVDFPLSSWLRETLEKAELLFEYFCPYDDQKYSWEAILEKHRSPVLLGSGLKSLVYEKPSHALADGLEGDENSKDAAAKSLRRGGSRKISMGQMLKDSNEDDDDDDDD